MLFKFMKNNYIPRNELVDVLRANLQQAAYSTGTAERHIRNARRIHAFMEEKKIKAYTPDVGEQFCDINDKAPLFKWVKAERRTVTHLLNRIVLGIPFNQASYQPKIFKIWGDFYEEGEAFLEKIKNENRLADHTILCNRRYLSGFSEQMFSQGITLESLKWENIVDFLSSQDKSILDYARIIRRFLSYLADKGLMATDIPDRLKHLKLPVKEKLPSVYLPEEILSIEDAPDRGTYIGKRDYAIILLGSRLGLRVSDIQRLQFNSIDWEENVIRITQYKTGKPLTLPLLNAVGEALIDYILYGRPKSDSSFIFLRAIAPFEPISAKSITFIISKNIQKSGVEVKGRHIGGHTLRHSLATALMNNHIPIETISESLGHSSIESTKFYLEVSISLLRQCTHDVPLVSNDFYNQKGGVLYE